MIMFSPYVLCHFAPKKLVSQDYSWISQEDVLNALFFLFLLIGSGRITSMFKGQSIFEIISAGGFTIYILIFCSIISIAVIIERVVYYQRRSQFSRIII